MSRTAQFNTAPLFQALQPTLDHLQSVSRLWLDATRQNFNDSLDLAQRVLDVRDADGLKDVTEATVRNARVASERLVQAGQHTLHENAAFAQQQGQALRQQTVAGFPPFGQAVEQAERLWKDFNKTAELVVQKATETAGRASKTR